MPMIDVYAPSGLLPGSDRRIGEALTLVLRAEGVAAPGPFHRIQIISK